ncbi:histidine phosphatase family protein [Wenxinia marina]|uniref:Fructose-2,6-bisphosphatase n=1 Tax=Wenxinia marina DSM 24838 TaxID=1123501 RepID=A0A0D0QE70_9RHOB|nr:histidine phosphatase family protein [Wenxinia marina]KIQ70642.1 Fructose-2,6-bisphosphatase [Wenxinia marina DSM 24838]GGL51533.1 phosphoglycerate mutase [Wenxinia marina]
MTRIVWVRHGPTHQRVFTGWRDVPADLSDAAALARLDAALPSGALLVSSDLARARATADALGRGRDRLPDDPRLREFDFGDWDGRHFSDIAETDPDLSRLYWEDPGAHAPPNGESWDAAAARVDAAVADLLAQAEGRDIVAVAHLGVILTRWARASGLPPSRAIGQRIEPLSLTETRLDGGRWSAGRVGHVC